MNKYHARKTTVDGITFDSAAEARRYMDLRLLERAREIGDLQRQVRFDFVLHGIKIGTYVADFTYTDAATRARVVEDVKGVRTPVYVLKKKLMKALHGIEISETGKGAKRVARETVGAG